MSGVVTDSIVCRFVGMLTITDFICVLQKYYKTANEKMEELEENEIQTWRDALKDKHKEFICISAEDSVLKAARMLIQYRIHRLPVMDHRTGNVLYILTHKRLLKFLHLYVSAPTNSVVLKSFLSSFTNCTYRLHSTLLKTSISHDG